MLRVDEVCKHSYIFSNLSIEPGHECFVITRMVNYCYGACSHLLIFCLAVEQEPMYNRTEQWWLESTHLAAREGKVLFNIIVKPRIFGLGMAPKGILSRLFNPFSLKMLDLYLEMWLWPPLICVEKALYGEVDIWDYAKTYTFNNFCLFLTLSVFFTIIILLFLLIYISLLPLFSLLELILSSFLPLLFITIIQQFYYFINNSVYYIVIIPLILLSLSLLLLLLFILSYYHYY